MERWINNNTYQEKQTEIEKINLEDVELIEVDCFERVNMQEWKDSKEDTKYW